jgi:hypothetical protein
MERTCVLLGVPLIFQRIPTVEKYLDNLRATSIHLFSCRSPHILCRGKEAIANKQGGPMICQKCGVGHMVDDSRHGITVFKCWVCGDRTYPEHPKRSGAFVCSRCGDDMEEKNELGLCKNCLRVLNIHAVRLKERNYGEFVCACGTTFMRKSPIQLFHSRECRRAAGADALIDAHG